MSNRTAARPDVLQGMLDLVLRQTLNSLDGWGGTVGIIHTLLHGEA